MPNPTCHDLRNASVASLGSPWFAAGPPTVVYLPRLGFLALAFDVVTLFPSRPGHVLIGRKSALSVPESPPAATQELEHWPKHI